MNLNSLSIYFQHHEIRIKLPKNYFKTEGKSYPLVIVQDGDYLFKDVNKDVVFAGVVPNDRKQDYTPWYTNVNGIEFDGKADDYLVWITSELLPYLKKCFSISEEQKDIAIAGASLGGLVSLYGLLTKRHAFGSFILISPSIWYPGFLKFMRKHEILKQPFHVYWYVGELEGKQNKLSNQNMISQTEQGVDILNELLISEQSVFHFVTNRKGIHRKDYFKKYFKHAIKKLF
ncbi:alpha/beta hydrolase [Staphylococcus xylosus]|uniref:alpha/beta hydrolase n=1 Tax=Staphylococcus xylosus TaxID=1288 RepID=UPI0004F6A4B7|nr:alpha/beta hydrolase-fold protein [Staphylococcus xylosus]MBE6180611.1 alpha/beta hydrolase [Staphylococcus xylosus]MCE4995080.1 alpha/beta hydrolase [Staphylococcus xylosus]MEB6298706.1 alpha/beta hydrolase-fold protein [Staphylococcus xylosus]OEK87340.1 esterase [Staphylococcus xylosus]RIM85754.1 alpha/beta hydrolase [Staphylococcus xylosus]